ncbi:MAG: 4-hydroxy-tetrahydrodipicolinate reductase [Oscillospiraceae bacterium]|nr:4-hydroxy-tetrahydrodipicolinate reductase [Oscillospiraceae bacterium]
MLKIIISGCNGHMGKVVARIAAQDPDIDVVAGFDINTEKTDSFPVFAAPMEFAGEADVVIDFSHPSALDGILDFCIRKNVYPVLCSTGYDQYQLEKINEAAKKIPVFKSANMSLGINVVAELLKRAASLLGSGYDVEIVEKHHNRKLDAPSGTALLLADAVSEALPYEPEYVYERQSRRQKRESNEIGISAVRCCTIVGIHEVSFCGLDEVIEIKHTAYSRDVFANGSVRAAKFLAGADKPGVYDMTDIIKTI